MQLILRLWVLLDSRRRRQFNYLLVLILVGSVAEIVSIGLIIPFLAVVVNPETVFNIQLLKPVIAFLDIQHSDQLVLPLTLGFISAILFSGIVRLLLLYSISRLSFMTGADISFNIYRNILYQPYLFHTTHNSSEIISSIVSKTSIITGNVLMPVLTLISAIILILTLFLTLLLVDPMIAFLTFGIFGFIYYVIMTSVRKQLGKNGDLIATESNRVIKSIQEGLGGIRDIIIDRSQEVFSRIYRSSDLSLRHAQRKNLFISASPRYLIETLSMILIVLLAYFLSAGKDGLLPLIPTLGAIALGAQRLMPILQQAFISWGQIKGSQASLADILLLLDNPSKADFDKGLSDHIYFHKTISLNDIGFKYDKNEPTIFSNISFNINKGDCVGIVGKTGCGKSTLVDVIMGLLKPSEGVILIDDTPISDSNLSSWQMHISHVPQNIFLADCSITENIAFGVTKDEIDIDLVQTVAQQADILNLINSLELGFETVVGENGIRMSGGQRQRIGIARALYKKSDVIIFDEATSALDNETENIIMNSIKNLDSNVTVIVIAHRLTTLKDCNLIIKIDNKGVLETGTYNQLIAK
jgi:ATP-binding cassette, subfamily B, bacterial PglK